MTRHESVFSSDPTNLREGWTDEDVTAVFADTTVDLTRDKPAEGAHLRVTAIFSNVTVLVPADLPVELDGLSVFGHREVRAPQGHAGLHIDSTAVFGNVFVKLPADASPSR